MARGRSVRRGTPKRSLGRRGPVTRLRQKGTSGVEHASRGMMDTWWLDQKQAEAFSIRHPKGQKVSDRAGSGPACSVPTQVR